MLSDVDSNLVAFGKTSAGRWGCDSTYMKRIYNEQT